MWEVVFLIIGLAAGSVVTWFWATSRARAAAERGQGELRERAAVAENTADGLRDRLTQHEKTLADIRGQLDTERQTRAVTETRLEETARQFEEQKRLLAEAEKKLKESFEALSAKALQTNAEQFLISAKKTLQTLMADAAGDLGKRQEAIKVLVTPLSESLKKLDEHNRELERARENAYASLKEQVKSLTNTNQQLQQETSKLVTSLRDPKVRGRWGEIALRRAAELAGMTEHCDFEQQTSFTTDDDRRYRPDMVVHLPGERTVAIDAKAVLDAYLDAVAATDEPARQNHLKRHADQVRSRVRELSSKSYWDKLGFTPEFVVLFLPAESFFSAAVEMDHTLIESAIRSKVILASPTTLIALLHAVHYGWRQEQITQNAEFIRELGQDLFTRMRILIDHITKVGNGLSTATRAYNSAVGSLETRVLPAARKFMDIKAVTGKEIPLIEPIEQIPREPNPPQLES